MRPDYKHESGRSGGNITGRLGRKYGFSVKFESLASNNPGHFDKGTNTMVLSENATQGEVIRQTFMHELTHLAAKSNMASELVDSVLTLKYGDNYAESEQYRNDYTATQELYAKSSQKLDENGIKEELTAESVGTFCTRLLKARRRWPKRSPALFAGSSTGSPVC